MLRYRKLEPARWLGHLDVMRCFERAFRRTDLPVAYTEGFNPRIRLAFASPLPVGTTGGMEAAVCLFGGEVGPAAVVRELNRVLPSGFDVLAAEARGRVLAGSVLAEFDRAEIGLQMEGPVGAIAAAVDALLASDALPVTREKERRTVQFDARPFLLAGTADDGEARLVLEVRQDGGVRPAELAGLLEARAPGCLVRSTTRHSLFPSRRGQPTNASSSTAI